MPFEGNLKIKGPSRNRWPHWKWSDNETQNSEVGLVSRRRLGNEDHNATDHENDDPKGDEEDEANGRLEDAVGGHRGSAPLPRWVKGCTTPVTGKLEATNLSHVRVLMGPKKIVSGFNYDGSV